MSAHAIPSKPSLTTPSANESALKTAIDGIIDVLTDNAASIASQSSTITSQAASITSLTDKLQALTVASNDKPSGASDLPVEFVGEAAPNLDNSGDPANAYHFTKSGTHYKFKYNYVVDPTTKQKVTAAEAAGDSDLQTALVNSNSGQIIAVD